MDDDENIESLPPKKSAPTMGDRLDWQIMKCMNLEDEIKELKIIAGWAAGKDPEVIIAQYHRHKKQFPELHE